MTPHAHDCPCVLCGMIDRPGETQRATGVSVVIARSGLAAGNAIVADAIARDGEKERQRAHLAAQMPPKDWAKVNANVVRAKAVIDEMRGRITHPGDLERLRVVKLALFDLDQLQTELHALVFGLVDKASFLTARGRELAVEALERRNRLEAAIDAMPEGETR